MAHLPPAPARVLELGAGSGWQSSLLVACGYEVTAVDVCPPSEGSLVRVLPIDGVLLPFATGSFDVAFSSNVLEHVVDLPVLLGEVDRVLRPSGRSVHLIPTPTWRVLTMVTFYVSLPSRAFRHIKARRSRDASAGPAGERLPARTVLHKVGSMLWESPHGEFSAAAAEIWAYRAAAWRRRLCGHVVAEEPAGVVYTGYGIFPKLSLRSRRLAARLLGSACRIYVVKPAREVG